MKRLAKTLLVKAGLRAKDEPSQLVEARVDEIIGLHHFRLGRDSVHPFDHAIRAGADNPARPAEAVQAALAEYYERVQPRDAAEWLGLSPECTPAELVGEPPYAVTFPWQDRSPTTWKKARARGIPRENKLAGHSLPIAAGWHACGPVAPEKIEVEARRLSTLLASLQAHGFLRHEGADGDIDGVLFLMGERRRYWINSGHHRAAALSALRYETVPVRVRKVMDLSRAAEWPNVKNGLFSIGAATTLIGRMFDDELPAVIAPWAEHLSSSQQPRNTAISIAR